MTDRDLGEFRREFKPGMENLVAGIIIGVLLISGGCAALYFPNKAAIQSHFDLPFWVEKGWCWGAVILLSLLGVGLIVGGLSLIGWMRSLVSLRVSVCQHGLLISEKNSNRVIIWDEIGSVQETHLYERLPLKGAAKYALPKMMNKIFLVKMKEGESFGFDGNTIKGHTKLAQMIKDETDSRNIAWEIVEEQA